MSEKIVKVLNSSKPIRMWIDGKCFNIKNFQEKAKKTSLNNNTIINSVSSNFGTDETSISSEKYIDNSGLFSSTFLQDEEGKLYTSFELPKYN